MILFEKLRYKNFLASGNQWHEYDFLSDRKSLIIGKNGTGKSTVLDALVFVIYGKAFRKIRKDQVVNSINGTNCRLELEFSIGNNKYKIVRSVKPNSFIIYENGVERKQEAAISDYQKYLENNILKMTKKTFTQIVILGSSEYIPFMRMCTNDRREIIEDLLDIQVFSLMKSLLKNRVDSISKTYSELRSKLKIIENSVELKTKHLSELEQRSEHEKDKIIYRIKIIKEEIEQIEKDLEHIENQFLQMSDDSSLEDKKLSQISKLTKISTKIMSSIKLHKNDITFFEENSSCPVCTQDISDELKNIKISDHTETLQELDFSLEKLKVTSAKINEELDHIRDNIFKRRKLAESIRLKKSEHNLKSKEREEAEESLESYIEEHVESVLKLEIEKLQENLDKKVEERSKISKKISNYSILSDLLKDTGIKTSIIRTYLPTINKLIRKYLDILDFNVDFRFDENFNEIIKSRFRDNFSYENFSEGQKMRIDLALLFVFREISRLRNSTSTNLLIFDEIGDSSLDSDGFDSFMNIIEASGVENQNVFVISHKGDILSDKFNSIYEFKLVDDYSVMIKD